MPCVRAAGVTILMRRVSGCSGFPAAFLFTHSPFSLNHSLRQPGEPHAGRKSEIVLKAMISLLPALYQRVLLPHQGVPPRGKIPLVGFPAAGIVSYPAGCKSDFFCRLSLHRRTASICRFPHAAGGVPPTEC